MFTGIIETIGRVEEPRPQGTNLEFTVSSAISDKLNIDQSVLHNGVCLTVTGRHNNTHTVIAVKETLDRSNLGKLKAGDPINLERAMPADGRFDGHMVQGHVDQQIRSLSRTAEDGSWRFEFEYIEDAHGLLVEKGSVCLSGVSLTVAGLSDNSFSVVVIPYTYEHTTFQYLQVGDTMNLEFDIIGKYIAARSAVS